MFQLFCRTGKSSTKYYRLFWFYEYICMNRNYVLHYYYHYLRVGVLLFEFVQIFYLYTQAVLKFTKLITEAQQREAVTQGRSLPLIPATVYLYSFFHRLVF
jgi:hypothetical protein